MTQKQLDAIQMVKLEGKKIHEVAKELKISTRTVSEWLHEKKYALNNMRQDNFIMNAY